MGNLESMTYEQIREVKSIVLHLVNENPTAAMKEIAQPIFDAFNKAYNIENGIDDSPISDDHDF
jgi:hypothetical protein